MTIKYFFFLDHISLFLHGWVKKKLFYSSVFFLSYFFTNIFFCSCTDSHSFRLKGEFANLRQVDFYIYSTDGGLEHLDTLHILNGEFNWKTPLQKEATFHVVFPNMSEIVIFAHPGDVISMKGDAEQLRTTTVTGNKENEEYTNFRLEHLNDTHEELITTMKDYIMQQPESRISNHLQLQMTIDDTKLSTVEIGDTLNRLLLPPDIITSKDTLKIDSGRPYLFIFWANWKRDSQDDFFYIRRFLRKNKQDNKQSIKPISISLDTDQEKYFFSIRYDSLNWENRCYRQSWNTPIVKQFGIKDIPFYILVNSQLEIIALGKNWHKDIEQQALTIIKKD